MTHQNDLLKVVCELSLDGPVQVVCELSLDGPVQIVCELSLDGPDVCTQKYKQDVIYAMLKY
jgi:hypothetical protein